MSDRGVTLSKLVGLLLPLPFLLGCESSEQQYANEARSSSREAAESFRDLLLKPDYIHFVQLFPYDYLKNAETAQSRFSEFLSFREQLPENITIDIVEIDSCVPEKLDNGEYWMCNYVAVIRPGKDVERSSMFFSAIKIDSKWFITLPVDSATWLAWLKSTQTGEMKSGKT